jgi:non-specific serine/threonine protein kinase
LRGSNARAALAELDPDRENLRAALHWSLDASDGDAAVALCASLGDYWRLRGMLTEGRAMIEAALAIDAASATERAKCLCNAGALARLQSDLPAAAVALREASRLAAARNIRVEALCELGLTLVALGDLDGAHAVLADAWELTESGIDDWERLLALHARGRLAVARGDLKLARRLRSDAVELAVASGAAEWEARARVGLGDVARLQRDYIGAREQFERALSRYREIENPVHLALGLRKLAHVALHLGDVGAARAALMEALAIFRRVEQPGGRSACAVGLACLLSARGDAVGATRLFGASGMAFEDTTGVLQPADLRDRDEAVSRCRTRLGDAAFEEALDQGRVTPLEELLETVATPGATPAADAPLHASLTPRELDVLRFLPQGLTYAEIGDALFISARTVDAHLRAIYSKLNVRSRHEAAGYALQHGLK